MRGKETWLLAAALGLVTWALYLWGHSNLSVPSVLAEFTAKSAAVLSKPPGIGNSQPIHKLRPGSAAHLNALRKTEFPAVSTTVVVPLPPFPTQQNLRTGTAWAQMRKTYGEPMLNVSELKAGHLFERWYYVNYDNTAMTVATLDDGFVSAVETLSKPYFGVHLGRSGS